MSWITLIPFLAFISYLTILIFYIEALAKSRQGRFFAAYLSFTIVFALSSWLMHADAAPSPLFWFKIELSAAFFLTPLIVNFASEFPHKKEKLSKAIVLWYLPALILEILLFKGLLIKEFELLPFSGGKVIIEFYPSMNILWAYTTISLVLASILFLDSYIKHRDSTKKLILLPFSGSLIMLFGGFLNIIPALRPYPFELAGNFIYSLLVAYAVVRYQFLSPGAILKKSSIYLLIALSFNALAIGAIYYIPSLSQNMPVWQLWLLMSPLALVLAFIFGPMRQKMLEIVDRTFFGEQYSYRRIIEEFSRKAASNLDFKEITNSLVELLNQVLKCPVALFLSQPKEEVLHMIKFAGFKVEMPENFFFLKSSPAAQKIIRDNKPINAHLISNLSGPGEVMKAGLEWLSIMEAELAVPLVFKGQLSGVLVLGKKKGMQPYNDEDISLLTTLSNQVAVALENARLYFESQEAYKELKNVQEHLIHSERVRVLGEVSGGMAHDLNNILAVISARTEMSLESIDRAEARRNLELVLKASQDGTEVVKRLQNFARRPSMELPERVDINRIIQDILSMAEHRRLEIEQKRGIFLEINCQLGALMQVRANSSEIRQAIINILFNAFEAIQIGGQVDIETRQEGKWVILSIRDSGTGMTSEVKKRLFEPFFTTKGERGSGLGLSVALGIVDKHQGKITVDSEPGKGSTFRIFLPSIEEPEGKEVAGKKEKVIAGKRERILIIEDDRNLGEIMEHFLNQAGYEAVLVNNGPDGLAQFQKNNFKLVITDWGLGSMTGGDIAQCINDMNSKVPIIVITGWQLDLPAPALKRLGIVEIISKPFNREEFLKSISRIVSSS